MRLAYYKSKEEKKKLQKIAHDLGERTLHCDFVDENGKATDGRTGRLIFCIEGEEDNSIERKFTMPSGDFFSEIASIRTFNQVYPLMYEGYNKTTFETLRKKLGIDAEERTPDQILSLYHFKMAERIKNSGIKSKGNIEMDDTDKLMIAISKNKMFLPRSISFVREMSLIYLITIFKAYVLNILVVVFRLNKELLKNAKTNFTYSDIIHSTNNDLFEKLCFNYSSNEIIDRGIKNLADKLKEIFSFDIKGNDWKKFMEYFERRNILIHNNGIPTKKYKKSFPEYALQEKLEVPDDYLLEAIKVFEKYQQKINSFFWRNYGEPAYLKEMTK